MTGRGAWLKVSGAVRRPAPAVLVAATDASVRGPDAGYGWLATDGRWGLGQCHLDRRQVGAAPVLVAELRAVAAALTKDTGAPVELVIDSLDAVQLLDLWAAGERRMPPGYLGSYARRSTLAGLCDLIGGRQRQISWTHVRSHAGHPLNEAADSLAKIAREFRQRGLNPREVESRASGLVEAFLASYADRRSP